MSITTELTLSDLLLQLDANTDAKHDVQSTIAYFTAIHDDNMEQPRQSLKELTEHEQELRSKIEETLIAIGGGSYKDKANGHTASLRTTKRQVIRDPDAVRVSLKAVGELERCLKLDEKRVLEIAKNVQLNGVEVLETTSLVVK